MVALRSVVYPMAYLYRSMFREMVDLGTLADLVPDEKELFPSWDSLDSVRGG